MLNKIECPECLGMRDVWDEIHQVFHTCQTCGGLGIIDDTFSDDTDEIDFDDKFIPFDEQEHSPKEQNDD